MLDILLVIAMLCAGWAALMGSDLFRCTISFMIFGLLMALIWARLNAIDLAIAEAAVGSGVTGGLLLIFLKRIERSPNRKDV